MDDAEFVTLIERARGGDDRAVEHLLHAFEADVRLMVRARLPRGLRNQFDTMDFVQAVWQSVFAGPERAALPFSNARHFRAFLAGIARNKVWEEHRRRTGSKKYDLAREERLYVRRGDTEAPIEVVSPDPSPSQEAQADDRMRQLAAGCNPAEIEVLNLRRMGLTWEEIAERTGLHERTVRRIVASLRDRMEARQWR